MTTAAVQYEPVIGLEVHVQLLTKSKMFCACPADYSRAEPNTYVCPICMGMPGVLPVINEQAVEYTITTGLALHCRIPEYSKFDRKNYPYPDLMKGYQISQYDMPLCLEGWLDIGEDGTERRAGITRVHLEEDTATSKHLNDQTGEGYSLIDINRAGSPLMEVVGEPDLRTADEARRYLMKLQRILRYIGVSHANPEEGNMRCDANVSLRPVGDERLGSKVEVKNMNSFRAVFRAIEYEIQRQSEQLDRGERIPQETRGWVEGEGRTVSQRSKEQAHDYRYFPEPDLPPLIISPHKVDEIRARLPELPDARRRRFEREYGLPAYDADLLTETRARADFFEAAVDTGNPEAEKREPRAKSISNWMLGDLAKLTNESRQDFAELKFKPDHLATLVDLIESGTITGKAAKEVFASMFETGKPPTAIVEESGLTQVSDASIIEEASERVIDANPKAVADYRGGKHEVVKFLVGQVMRETRGRANPAAVTDILERLLRGQ